MKIRVLFVAGRCCSGRSWFGRKAGPFFRGFCSLAAIGEVLGHAQPPVASLVTEGPEQMITRGRDDGEGAINVTKYTGASHGIVGINIYRPAQAAVCFGLAQAGKDAMQHWSSRRHYHQLKARTLGNARHRGGNGAEYFHARCVLLALQR